MLSTFDHTLVDADAAPRVSTPPPEAVISVRGVSKMYRLYDRPEDRLKQSLFWRFGRSYGREFWALRDVSFEVQQGEAVGIIGRNGSGKSTLLQIIAGTLQPTTGEVQIKGRVAALLELGSGFNSEYTGRENVFMNGAILGLGREEMEQRFDDIAAFADIGEFIDQPIKLYSSGMVMRLAFAVQAMVPKEVLIVDEALAVGDEAFQRKCMRALEDFQASGGTVLLVSHGAQTIVRQCGRCLFLHTGELMLDGPSKPVTDLYQRFLYGSPQQQREMLPLFREHGVQAETVVTQLKSRRAERPESAVPEVMAAADAFFDSSIPSTNEIVYGNGAAEIFDWGMYDERGCRVNVVVAGRRYIWRYRVRFYETAFDVGFGMMIKTVEGIEVAALNNMGIDQYCKQVDGGQVVEIRFRLHLNIAPGTYFLNSGVVGDTAKAPTEGGFLQRRIDLCAVRVIAPDSRLIAGLAYLDPQFEMEYL